MEVEGIGLLGSETAKAVGKHAVDITKVLSERVYETIIPGKEELALSIASVLIGADVRIGKFIDNVVTDHVAKAFGQEASKDARIKNAVRFGTAVGLAWLVKYVSDSVLKDEGAKRLAKYATAFAITPYAWRSIASVITGQDLFPAEEAKTAEGQNAQQTSNAGGQ